MMIETVLYLFHMICFQREGNIPDIVASGSLHEFLSRLHLDYGSIVSFWWGQKMCVSISTPKLFEEQAHVFDRPCKCC